MRAQSYQYTSNANTLMDYIEQACSNCGEIPKGGDLVRIIQEVEQSLAYEFSPEDILWAYTEAGSLWVDSMQENARDTLQDRKNTLEAGTASQWELEDAEEYIRDYDKIMDRLEAQRPATLRRVALNAIVAKL